MKSTPQPIAALTRFKLAPAVCFSPCTDDGCVVLNIEEGKILSLNDVGALMFSRLAASNTGLTRDEFVNMVGRDFNYVEHSRIESAVDNLLRQLDEKKALQTQQSGFHRVSWWVRAKLVNVIIISVSAILTPLLSINANTLAGLLLLATADIVLKLTGFSMLYRAIKRWPLANRRANSATIMETCNIVDRACTWHPRQELCLQRSAVAACLLRSFGVPAEMVIGVHKMPFYGHAWVEVEGKVVNDHKNVQTFFHVLSRC
jgi:hypothetical protein